MKWYDWLLLSAWMFAMVIERYSMIARIKKLETRVRWLEEDGWK